MSTRLTTTLVNAAICPPEKTEILLWDSACSGLAVRVHASGAKTWCVRYRAGRGRNAPLRRVTLGGVEKLGPAEARTAARKFLGDIAMGLDPAGKAAADKAEAKAIKASALGAAIDDYERELNRRQIVKRSEVLSALRRELRDKFGSATDVRALTRRQIVDRIDEIAKTRPGAADYLRKASTGFFEWLANRGLISVSPLAGYRKPRRTRAEMIDQPGRALSDEEIVKLWAATGSRFGTLVRICLLTGTRRGEAAAMVWGDLDLEAGEWTIRAEVAKTGRGRVVYLAPLAVDLLRSVPRISGTALVFASDAGTVITGWTKRVAAVAKAAGVEFTMHDTRRTFRTAISRLGIDRDTAELCLGHWRGDLIEAYDRDTAEKRQRAAVERWAGHVHSVVTGTGGKVVSLARAAS
jgi:integrase